MIDDIVRIADFNDEERDIFRKAIHRLFAGSFVLRCIRDEEEMYSFIVRNRAVFDAYCECAGWTLRVDEPLGVVSWKGPSPARFILTRDETVMLVIARLLYEEKKGEISLLEYPALRAENFLERYRTLTGIQLKKTRFSDLIRRLQSLRLVRMEGSELTSDTMIAIYPSIALALDSSAVNSLHEKITRDSETASPDFEEQSEEIDADLSE